MADVLEDQESLARAILEQDPRSVVTEKEKRIHELRKALQEGSPRSATEAMQSRALDQDQIDKANERAIRASRDENLLEKRDEKGKKIRDEDKLTERIESSQSASALANDYLRSFDRLETSQKDQIVAKVRQELVELWPPAAELLRSGVVNERDVIVNLLRDPKFAEKVKTRLEGLVQSAQKIPEMPQEIMDRIKEAERKKEKLGSEIKKKDDEIGEYQKVIDDFLSRSPGSKGKELEGLPSEETLINEISEWESNKKKYERKIEDERDGQRSQTQYSKTSGISAEEKKGYIEAAQEHEKTAKGYRKDIEGLDDQIRDNHKKLEKRRTLEQQKAEAERKKKEVEEQKELLETEKSNTEIALHKAKADQNIVMYDIEMQEKTYEKEMGNIFKNATQEYIMERITDAEDKVNEILKKEKDKAESDSKKGFFDMLQKRWIREYPSGNGQIKKIENKKDVIQADFNALMRGGPDQLMESILRAQEPSLSDEEIEKMMKDEEFKKDAQAKMLERIVAKRMQVGSLTSGEAEKILDSEWGASLINKAYENNPKMKAQIDDLREKGIVRGKLSEWMRNNKGKTGMIIALLLLLLTGVGFGVAAALPITLT